MQRKNGHVATLQLFSPALSFRYNPLHISLFSALSFLSDFRRFQMHTLVILAVAAAAAGIAVAGTNEAGLAYLAENRGKDGVVELPSGLQYKVTRVQRRRWRRDVAALCVLRVAPAASARVRSARRRCRVAACAGSSRDR
jgi:hypothetical protein